MKYLGGNIRLKLSALGMVLDLKSGRLVVME
jgi:hypothetical protein